MVARRDMSRRADARREAHRDGAVALTQLEVALDEVLDALDELQRRRLHVAEDVGVLDAAHALGHGGGERRLLIVGAGGDRDLCASVVGGESRVRVRRVGAGGEETERGWEEDVACGEGGEGGGAREVEGGTIATCSSVRSARLSSISSVAVASTQMRPLSTVVWQSEWQTILDDMIASRAPAAIC